MSSRYSYPHEDQYKFTFGTDASGTPTTVARMYEVDHGRLKAERIGRNDSFSVEVDPATGQVVEVEQTRLGRYKDERTVFSDADGDGYFTKVFEIETVNSLGTSRGQFEKHKFTFDAVTGEVTADLELTRGRWRADRIDANEDYQIVTDAAGNELIVKSEYERDGVEFEIFRDDNNDGIWAQIAEGEAGMEMLQADGTLDVSLLIPMLPADTGVF